MCIDSEPSLNYTTTDGILRADEYGGGGGDKQMFRFLASKINKGRGVYDQGSVHV